MLNPDLAFEKGCSRHFFESNFEMLEFQKYTLAKCQQSEKILREKKKLQQNVGNRCMQNGGSKVQSTTFIQSHFAIQIPTVLVICKVCTFNFKKKSFLIFAFFGKRNTKSCWLFETTWRQRNLDLAHFYFSHGWSWLWYFKLHWHWSDLWNHRRFQSMFSKKVPNSLIEIFSIESDF